MTTAAALTDSSAAEVPFLAVDDLRVDVEGVPRVDGLSFKTMADHVLVLGAPRALFLATARMLPVARGTITIAGKTLDHCAIAAAPFDPPLPPSWTPLEYVTWSARLGGISKGEARARAEEAIARVELEPLAKTAMPNLVPHARRATVLAAALVTGASTIVLEDPVGALAEEAAHAYARVIVSGLHDRSWIVFAPRMALTSPLTKLAKEAIVVSSSRVEVQAPPAEIGGSQRRFVLRLYGSIDDLVPRLDERGVQTKRAGAQLVVDLGESVSTAELIALCVEANVTVVELHPLSHALV